MSRIIIVGANTVVVDVDPAGNHAEGSNEIAFRVGLRHPERIASADRMPPSTVGAGTRTLDVLSIDDEDILTQADEANVLDPVG
jgi:hypothetical protein